eukprot:1161423-Prorocentrum_minimum.AAC.3
MSIQYWSSLEKLSPIYGPLVTRDAEPFSALPSYLEALVVHSTRACSSHVSVHAQVSYENAYSQKFDLQRPRRSRPPSRGTGRTPSLQRPSRLGDDNARSRT